jgi:hypothetical protein
MHQQRMPLRPKPPHGKLGPASQLPYCQYISQLPYCQYISQLPYCQYISQLPYFQYICNVQVCTCL